MVFWVLNGYWVNRRFYSIIGGRWDYRTINGWRQSNAGIKIGLLGKQRTSPWTIPKKRTLHCWRKPSKTMLSLRWLARRGYAEFMPKTRLPTCDALQKKQVTWIFDRIERRSPIRTAVRSPLLWRSSLPPWKPALERIFLRGELPSLSRLCRLLLYKPAMILLDAAATETIWTPKSVLVRAFLKRLIRAPLWRLPMTVNFLDNGRGWILQCRRETRYPYEGKTTLLGY